MALMALFLILTLSGTVSALPTPGGTGQPDLLVENSGETVYAGDNVYNSDGTDQTKTQDVKNYDPATYKFIVQNDGASTDNFKVTGTASGDGWTIQYFDDSNNDITAAITGTGWIVNLASGTSREFTAKVSAGLNVAIGAKKDVLITATSGDKTLSDTVKASTTYTAGLYDINIGPVILPGNDDSSTGTITLPFTNNFYGTPYNSIKINNNGQISFNGIFTSPSFHPLIPNINGASIIAAFCDDIITNYPTGGQVHYDATSSRAVITWDRVCSFDLSHNVYNTFQVIIRNDGRIIFSYGDMQWVNGDSTSSALFDKGDTTNYSLFWSGTQPLSNIAYKTFWFTSDGQEIPQTDVSLNEKARVNGGVWQDIDPSRITAHVGDTVEFLVTATNIGPKTANGIQILDITAPGITVTTVTPSGTSTYNAGMWTINNLAPGASETLLVRGIITQSNVITSNFANIVNMIGYIDTNNKNNIACEIINTLPPIPTVNTSSQQTDSSLKHNTSNTTVNAQQVTTATTQNLTPTSEGTTPVTLPGNTNIWPWVLPLVLIMGILIVGGVGIIYYIRSGN